MAPSHLLLQLYYSIMDDIHFHQTQLSNLEQRARDVQNEIISSYSRYQQQQQELPFILRNLRNSRRRRNTTYSRTTLDPSTEEPEPEPPVRTRTTSNPFNPITPSLSATSPQRDSPFTYLGTFDVPTTQTDNPLPTSFARSILSRSLPASASTSNTTTSPNYDAGSLLLYFMMENLANDRGEEQHGITDVSRYITDMLYHEVEDPPNTCCPIKMDVFTDEMEVSQINKCKHLFCRQEIRTWLESHHTCPLCRTAIDT